MHNIGIFFEIDLFKSELFICLFIFYFYQWGRGTVLYPLTTT